MFELVLWIFIICLCLLFEGFFSGTETAMVSLDRARIKALAEKGSRREAQLDVMLRTPERFFSTTLLGTNISAVLANAIATFLIITHLGEAYKYITIIIMTPVILVLGEIVSLVRDPVLVRARGANGQRENPYQGERANHLSALQTTMPEARATGH